MHRWISCLVTTKAVYSYFYPCSLNTTEWTLETVREIYFSLVLASHRSRLWIGLYKLRDFYSFFVEQRRQEEKNATRKREEMKWNKRKKKNVKRLFSYNDWLDSKSNIFMSIYYVCVLRPVVFFIANAFGWIFFFISIFSNFVEINFSKVFTLYVIR